MPTGRRPTPATPRSRTAPSTCTKRPTRDTSRVGTGRESGTLGDPRAPHVAAGESRRDRAMRAGRVPRMPRWLRWKWGGGVVYAAASAGSRVTRSRSPYVSSCRPEEPHPMESEIRARSNSLGCPRLPRLTSPRAWWHQTSPTSPDDGGDFHTTRVGSERAHGLLRQPRHGSRAWYCPFTLASGSDPRHQSRVALLVVAALLLAGTPVCGDPPPILRLDDAIEEAQATNPEIKAARARAAAAAYMPRQ